ncbi:phosphopantetheine-binding protein [Oleisolibacter albus]|uniref:phosphopantetheine-binding protein n=1 Tax=Oleisolibacter albus TaxID=2171757 RepID=UPI000DF31B13|nr:phosphopantetheine-binding protein [Oleisolibacter albus]
MSLEAEIKLLIIKSLDLEDVQPADIGSDLPLFGEGLGLDSIDALELGVALQKRYGIKIDGRSDEIRGYFRSVSTLAELVRQFQSA